MAAPKKRAHVDTNKVVLRGKMKKASKKLKSVENRRKGNVTKKKVKFAPDANYAGSDDEMVSENMKVNDLVNNESGGAGDIRMKMDRQNMDDDDDEDDVKGQGNAGWADAMAKILGTSAPKDKPVLLAKAKMDRDTLDPDDSAAPKVQVEVVPEAGVKETTAKLSLDERRKLERKLKYEQREKKNQWVNMARQKPNVTERDRERALSRIATKGVIQLFNAVKVQQQAISSKLKDVGGSERKREKVMKTVTKGAFLDVLKGKAKSIQVDTEIQNLSHKKAQSDEAPTWHILRDDFMLGAKMKDWDKRNDEDEEG